MRMHGDIPAPLYDLDSSIIRFQIVQQREIQLRCQQRNDDKRADNGLASRSGYVW